MQTEQMIKEIRNRVILDNNPECKTLEKAYRKESGIVGCEISYRKSKQHNFLKYCIGNYDNHYYTCYSEVKTITLHEDSFYTTTSDFHKVLGLPLTLERLLVSISRISSKIEEVKLNLSPRLPALCVIYGHDSFIWSYGKTLDQQSEETMQEIYNILYPNICK